MSPTSYRTAPPRVGVGDELYDWIDSVTTAPENSDIA
jgi:hypothetical protein